MHGLHTTYDTFSPLRYFNHFIRELLLFMSSPCSSQLGYYMPMFESMASTYNLLTLARSVQETIISGPGTVALIKVFNGNLLELQDRVNHLGTTVMATYFLHFKKKKKLSARKV